MKPLLFLLLCLPLHAGVSVSAAGFGTAEYMVWATSKPGITTPIIVNGTASPFVAEVYTSKVTAMTYNNASRRLQADAVPFWAAQMSALIAAGVITVTIPAGSEVTGGMVIVRIEPSAPIQTQ